ncbi:hypothetical protein OIU84_022711 [Salix udensis]|uniref:Uncharacterized protein n=1 Tax=Salix udensis TaxID=889485 RepID=A0AAD6KP50_9ROSI|nr:hypothetical protein OIU84_022711 [Salix udensis]
MNHYMNQQQLQLQQQQLQQLQQQQQQPSKATTTIAAITATTTSTAANAAAAAAAAETSSLQAVVAPSQVGSPSTMGIPQLNQQTQQQPSPQQMSPQLSSGAIHAISSGNPEAGPASPQLSSQTLGSAWKHHEFSMELEAVNKRNSVSNA